MALRVFPLILIVFIVYIRTTMRAITGTTSPRQSRFESNGNEVVLEIFQSLKTAVSYSDED